MTTFFDPRNPDFPTSGSIAGYEIKRVAEIKGLQSFFYELEHIRTGSRHIHVSRDDRDNTFSVAFKTVPRDSSGVAHILEHIVLCGSRKYPVRDPFFSMLKRSLNSFMNAFTASDWTMYPFSTPNARDYYNLADVYLDATFFPLLEPLSFKQEGHRLELLTPNGNQDSDDWELGFQGVVYNEMKGAMSSPPQVMARSLLKALYPDTIYRFNSGGDPAVIPDLTFEQLQAFHRQHYHPSNASFYTYGNLPLQPHLEFIEQTVLQHFEHIAPNTEVTPQPRWSTSREATFYYPLQPTDPTDDLTRKSQVCLAWLMADITATPDILTLALLEQILLGNAASPLRKALLDSQLGSALCDGTGFDADNRDSLFVCGLKDVAVTDAPIIEAIILDTLKDLVHKGIPAEMVDSALHQIEFNRKEITHTPYPFGIKLLLNFAGSWFHGAEVLPILEFDTLINLLRQKVQHPDFLLTCLEKFFLHNTHRVRFVLAPDPTLAETTRQELKEKLATLKARLTPADIKQLKAESAALQSRQESAQDLSCLPTLHKSDIPPEVERLPAISQAQWPGLVIYDQPTAGIFYLNTVLGLNALSPDRLPLLPFFSYAFTRMGTREHDYAVMSQRMAGSTGGIGLGVQPRTGFAEAQQCLPLVSFNGKCLERNLTPMLDIMAELATAADFSNHTRLKHLLLEYKAGLETAVVQNGHQLALLLAARAFSPTAALKANWQGVYQLRFMKSLTRQVTESQTAQQEAALARIAADLTDIKDQLFGAGGLQSAITGETAALQQATDHLFKAYPQILPAGAEQRLISLEVPVDQALPYEGWETSSTVSFVAACHPVARLTHPDAPALAVISKMVRSLYLHQEIREKGGAYGGFAVYDSEDGVFGLGSYRDPHITRTLRVYAGALDFIHQARWSEADLEEAVLQVCAVLDKPQTPAEAARRSFYRRVLSLTDDQRQRYKTALLALTTNDIRKVAERYFNPETTLPGIAVISGPQQLAAANAELAERPLRLYQI